MQNVSNPIRRSESYAGKQPRNIMAPYQRRSADNDQSTNPNSSPRTRSSSSSSDLVDYRNFKFVDLEDVSAVKFEKYCGPTPESNWVIPRVLLVGAYPASQDDAETYDLITSILKQGVTKFVCLQQEYRDQGVTEEMWRSGHALRPYFRDVQMLVRNKAMFPDLQGYNIVDEEQLTFVHFPIRDCGVTDDGRVLELARNLVKSISNGEMVYLHCWGGHGRTGTLVCIMLHLMYGLDAVEAMSRCQLVHDLRKCPVVVGSPQTQTQRDQVTRVIHRLQTQTQFHRRTLSDLNSYTELLGGEQRSPRSLAAPAGVAHSHNSSNNSNNSNNSPGGGHGHGHGHYGIVVPEFPPHHPYQSGSRSPSDHVNGAADNLDTQIDSTIAAAAVAAAAGAHPPPLRTSADKQKKEGEEEGDDGTSKKSASTASESMSMSISPSEVPTDAAVGRPVTGTETGSAMDVVDGDAEADADADGGYFIGADELLQDSKSSTVCEDVAIAPHHQDEPPSPLPSSSSSSGSSGGRPKDNDFHIAARPPESVAPTSATTGGGAIAGLRNFRMQWTTAMTTNSDTSDGLGGS